MHSVPPTDKLKKSIKSTVGQWHTRPDLSRLRGMSAVARTRIGQALGYTLFSSHQRTVLHLYAIYVKLASLYNTYSKNFSFTNPYTHTSLDLPHKSSVIIDGGQTSLNSSPNATPSTSFSLRQN